MLGLSYSNGITIFYTIATVNERLKFLEVKGFWALWVDAVHEVSKLGPIPNKSSCIDLNLIKKTIYCNFAYISIDIYKNSIVHYWNYFIVYKIFKFSTNNIQIV